MWRGDGLGAGFDQTLEIIGVVRATHQTCDDEVSNVHVGPFRDTVHAITQRSSLRHPRRRLRQLRAVGHGFMHPVLGAPTTLAIGHPNNDVWNHVWGYGFVAQSLAAGEWPMHTDLLNWPHGGTLWFIDLLGALITLPINWLSGPVAAYNSGMLIQWVLAGVGMYALAWRVTGSIAGA